MTINRRAELDMIGFDVGNDPAKQGQVALRWRKMTYDGDTLVATEYHRAMIDADTDLDATLEAVEADMERQGYSRPPAHDRAYIESAASLAWTDEVKSAVAADRKRRNSEAEAEARAEAENKARSDAAQKQFDDAVSAAVARLSKKPE